MSLVIFWWLYIELIALNLEQEIMENKLHLHIKSIKFTVEVISHLLKKTKRL